MNHTQEIRMVDLHKQFLPLEEEIMAGWQQVLRQSSFINGPPVAAFENELATYLRINHVIGCANGTDALLIALLALGIKPGDEVITTPFTFVATVESIALLGAIPVFVDIQPLTYNLDPKKIESAITSRTKGILPVHLYGQCADMEPILKIAYTNELWVLEDNAQSIGAEYRFSQRKTAKAGTMGHIGTTSFYPSKNLGAYGDAGAIFTSSDEMAHKCRAIRDHGHKKKYLSEEVGVNSRLDSLQAIVLSAKLKRLESYNLARKTVALAYNAALKECSDLDTPFAAPWSTHVYHQYTLRVDKNRDILREKLAQAGIPSMIYYPYPLHLHKPYRAHYKEGDFSISEDSAKQTISLPIHTEMTMSEISFIAETFIHIYRNI